MNSVGIDLGTKKICAGIFERNSFSIIESINGREHSNYVTFRQNDLLIGEASRNKIRTNLNNTVFDIKILINHFKNKDTLDLHRKRWPFEIAETMNDERLKIKINQNEYHQPEEIVGILLKNIKEKAKEKMNQEIKKAVITVPSGYNDSQRQVILDAAKIAGFDRISLLNDSTSAAIALTHENRLTQSKNIFIFDLGAYYLNLCVFDILGGGSVQIKASTSTPELGGKMFDYNIAKHIEPKIPFKINKKQFLQLLFDCEKCKETLSNTQLTEIVVESTKDNDKDFRLPISREKFEEINLDLFDDCKNQIKYFLENAKINKNDINEIVMIGGSSRIPKLQSLVSELFNKKRLNFSMNASETVAYGAMIQSDPNFKNKYKEILNHNYNFIIQKNGKNYDQLELKQFEENIPFQKRLVIKDFNSLSIELKENQNIIYNKKDLNLGKKFDSLCFSFHKNGLVEFYLKKDEKIIELIETRQNCLTKNEILKIADPNFVNKKLSNSIEEQLSIFLNDEKNKKSKTKKEMLVNLATTARAQVFNQIYKINALKSLFKRKEIEETELNNVNSDDIKC